MSDQDLSVRYWEMQKSFWLGFFIPTFTEHAFGKIMMTYPGEFLALIMEMDKPDSWEWDEVFEVLEDVATRWRYNPGVHFNMSWKQSHDAVKSYIKDNGYHHDKTVKNYLLKAPESIDGGEINLVKTTDGDIFKALYLQCFDSHPVRAQMLGHTVERGMNNVQNDFFIAYKGEEIIGFGATAIDEQKIGYYHTLGVLAPFRRNGYAGQIIAALCDHMKSEGCSHIFTAVEAANKTSIALQEKMGFSLFEDWEIWLK